MYFNMMNLIIEMLIKGKKFSQEKLNKVMSGLKIISWNINGLRAIAKKNFTEWLAEESPDIVCVQEIKAMPEQVPENITKLESHKGYYFSAERKG